MKHLKFEKIKIAKINNLRTISGGAEQTIIRGCMPDTIGCFIESLVGYTCPTTTNGGTLRTQGGYEDSAQCGD